MSCKFQEQCGGCSLRNLEYDAYCHHKKLGFEKIIQGINQENISFGEPIFVADGQRRRASFAFEMKKGVLTLGFNEAKSNNILDIDACALLSDKINANCSNLRNLLLDLCAVKNIVKQKAKKFIEQKIHKGDVWVCEADNGLDIVLEFDMELNMEHRQIIFEKAQDFRDVIRISHRRKVDEQAEPIVEKSKPIIKIADYDVYISAGTFLQPSRQGELALISLVQKYLGETRGKIADLFCGIGTFSYPLSLHKNNYITSIDSSKSLLAGFQNSVNKNQIPNINILEKNLFKYPLDEKELQSFEAIVIDPPRAGASSQVNRISQPPKVVYVSCNPHSFVKDANVLLEKGYKLVEITLVDQFIYSHHNELVAFFEKRK